MLSASDFFSTNNKAKYEVLIAGLRISKELAMQHLKACNNSQLIGHVCDKYEAKEENIHKYLSKVKDLIRIFQSFDI